MGDVLMTKGDKAGAMEHWQAALTSAEKVRPDLQEASAVELKKKMTGSK